MTRPTYADTMRAAERRRRVAQGCGCLMMLFSAGIGLLVAYLAVVGAFVVFGQ